MAMLDRYKKSGGFKQLVALLETCGPAKRDKFMELIRSENSSWADALSKKLLDVKRIYAWPDDYLQEVIGNLQDLTVATLLLSADEASKKKISSYLTHSRKRIIDELMATSKPNPAETATMQMKLIETVRKMVAEGQLRFDKFDPDLVIEEDIEERLSKNPPSSTVVAFSEKPSSTPNPYAIEYETGMAPVEPTSESSSNGGATAAEVNQLKRRIADLSKENANLRQELNVAKSKLDQIKKIA